MTPDDQSARLYAANLLNRAAGQSFDHRDVAVLARILPLIEADAADFLKRCADKTDAFRFTSRSFLHTVADAIREGAHRPELPQSLPASASFESNVR